MKLDKRVEQRKKYNKSATTFSRRIVMKKLKKLPLL